MSLFRASLALKATLLLALAAVVDRALLRRASAAARHLLWTFAVAGLLLLPVLGWTLPAWSPPVLAPRAAVHPLPRESGASAVQRIDAPPRAGADAGAVRNSGFTQRHRGHGEPISVPSV